MITIQNCRTLAQECASKVANLPDAGSGGARLSTCTVNVGTNYTGYLPDLVVGTRVTGVGTIEAFSIYNSSETSRMTIYGVLCGSALTVRFGGVGSLNCSSIQTTNCELIDHTQDFRPSFKITAPDGGIATIYNPKTATSEPD